MSLPTGSGEIANEVVTYCVLDKLASHILFFFLRIVDYTIPAALPGRLYGSTC